MKTYGDIEKRLEDSRDQLRNAEGQLEWDSDVVIHQSWIDCLEWVLDLEKKEETDENRS
jgi:hypothetical protein